MYYAALLVFVALAVFFITTVLNAPSKREDRVEKLNTQDVQYTPPKRQPPKRTEGGASRNKDEENPNQR